MSEVSYRVYIDESGDEGFVFHGDGTGSSRWLVLSAVITRYLKDGEAVKIMDAVRSTLKRQPRTALHFVKLRHEQKVAYARVLGQSPSYLRTVSVLVYKPSIKEPEKFRANKHRLYRYVTRLLLERVSWFCRDHRKDGEGDGRAEIIFSNRGQMSYDEIRDYLRKLRDNHSYFESTIDWSVIDCELISAIEHSQRAGLQIADAVASGHYAAVNLNPYGDAEGKYAELLLPICYRHENLILSYGLKFWPEDVGSLVASQPHLQWFTSLK